MTTSGPRTAEGKAVVARNAVRHGITSTAVVLPGGLEREEDWRAFRDAVVGALEPDGALEQELAELVASTSWRRRRVARFERELVASRLERHERESALMNAPDATPRPFHVVPHTPTFEALARYEAHLDRQFYRSLHELRDLQARRRGEAAPMARVELHGLPGG